MRSVSFMIVFMALALLAMGASGCYFMSEPSQMYVYNASNESQQNVTGLQPPGEVIIKDFAFIPSEITIAKGGKVLFINQDSVKHTITSDSAPPSFNNEIRPGIGLTQFFYVSGTYNYHCVLHPDMKGKVIVQ